MRHAPEPARPGRADFELLDRTRPLNQSPFAGRTADPGPTRRIGTEQGPLDGGEIRWATHDDQNGDSEQRRKLTDVDDVEAADRNTLKEHRTNVIAELAFANEHDHAPGGVRTIAEYVPADDAVEPCSCAHRSDEQHAAPVPVAKRPVVEPDDVHGLPSSFMFGLSILEFGADTEALPKSAIVP